LQRKLNGLETNRVGHKRSDPALYSNRVASTPTDICRLGWH